MEWWTVFTRNISTPETDLEPLLLFAAFAPIAGAGAGDLGSSYGRIYGCSS